MALTPEEQQLKDGAIRQREIAWVQECRALSRLLGEAFSKAIALEKQYYDLGLATDLLDLDLANFPFEKTEVQDFVNLLTQFRSMATNQPVQQGDWQAINNKIK